MKPKLVAELFEPLVLFQNNNQCNLKYEIFINESPYDEVYKANFRKKVNIYFICIYFS